MSDVTFDTIETRVPARLDRLPWSRFHWLIVVGLGTVWILDGLEVTIVGSVGSRMSSAGSGIHITVAQIGVAGAIYVGGACTGALFFGQLTDRFGRKKLFMVTLGVYICATVATAFSSAPWFFFAARLLTGFGIGGEYAAINSAIDELIPARMRGTADLSIDGSYWFGSMAGAAAAILFLNTSVFPESIGWRLTFALGATLGVGILIVRRHVPESPRWLFIYGREQEAEAIVGRIEEGIEQEAGVELDEPGDSLAVRQRERISFRQIAAVAWKVYPKRTVLGLALFVGQAFIYNGITFNLGDLFTKYYGVSSGFVPVFLVIYAFGNLAGPLLLGRLFDTVGRKPMLARHLHRLGGGRGGAGDRLRVARLGTPVGVHRRDRGHLLPRLGGGQRRLPHRQRDLPDGDPCACHRLLLRRRDRRRRGGWAGPLLFGNWIASGNRSLAATAFLIGSGIMAAGGLSEVFFGVKAEQASLEDVAAPLTIAEAEDDGEPPSGAGEGGPAEVAGHARRAEELEALAAAVEESMAAAEARQRRLRERLAERQTVERSGLRRLRPGPGSTFFSPGMVGNPPLPAVARSSQGLEVEEGAEAIGRALEEHGPLDRRDLERLVGARYWGPGRFRPALREALRLGLARQRSRNTFGPPGRDDGPPGRDCQAGDGDRPG